MAGQQPSHMDDLAARLRQSQISQSQGIDNPHTPYGQPQTTPQGAAPSAQQLRYGAGPQEQQFQGANVLPPQTGQWGHQQADSTRRSHGAAQGRGPLHTGYPLRQSTFPPARNVSLMDFVRPGPNSPQAASPAAQSPASQFPSHSDQSNPGNSQSGRNPNLLRQQTFPGQLNAYHQTGNQSWDNLPRNQGFGKYSGNQGRPRFNPHSREANLDPPDFERFVAQCSHLDDLASTVVPEASITTEELALKEKFRLKLQKICCDALLRRFPNLPSHEVDLVPYGSIQSGFATKNSDMDILFLWKDGPRMDAEVLEVVADLMEQELLDCGIGARLISKTRVPVLKVCEFPLDGLLERLLLERKRLEEEKEHKKEEKTDDSIEQLGEIRERSLDRPTSSHHLEHEEGGQTAIPESQEKSNPNNFWFRERPPGPLDFPARGVGIQCDIGFTKFLGIYNTQLLRCYSACDPRVKQVVIFVKAWAKRRKINSGYNGTLSSYGWSLMVLHFLMNVAKPPVIPNLQRMPLEGSEGQKRRQFDNYDIEFYDDIEKLGFLAQQGKLTQNVDPIGSLLRGFFQYYAQRGGHIIGGGFDWKSEIISIRTPSGLLPKQSKGWTAAKTQTQNGFDVRQRYLLAIECPMETDHNVARTVHHNGVVAIRDELRRAWKLLESVGGVRTGEIRRLGGLMDYLRDGYSVPK